MPAWLLSALAMLGRGGTRAAAIARSGRRLALPAAAGAGGAAAAGALMDGDGGFLDVFGGDEAPRRRRRRRALTQQDRDDISFITGMLGPAAGKQFALTLAGRSR